MAEPTPQTFQNHSRMVPLFHYVAFPIFLLNFIWTAYRMVTNFSLETALGVLVAAGFLLLSFFSRTFALGAQDRVIRLEERIRMQALLPDELKPRIGDFTTAQMVALRFASDAELPELARRVLDDNIAEQKSIKEAIKNWRPDHQRV